MLEWRCRRLDLDFPPPPPSLSLSLSHFVITIYGTKHKEQKSLDLTPLEKERGKWTAVQVERACCLWGVALAIRGNISLAVDFNTTGPAASSILAAVQRFSGTQQAARGEARQGGETISLSWQRQPPRPVAPPGHWLLSQKERTEQSRRREREREWDTLRDCLWLLQYWRHCPSCKKENESKRFAAWIEYDCDAFAGQKCVPDAARELLN